VTYAIIVERIFTRAFAALTTSLRLTTNAANRTQKEFSIVTEGIAANISARVREEGERHRPVSRRSVISRIYSRRIELSSLVPDGLPTMKSHAEGSGVDTGRRAA
jgi:hypothetical protein